MFIKRLGNRWVMRDSNDGTAGGGTPTPSSTPEKETFSREYVHELREENKSQRLKAQEAQDAAKKAKEEADAAKADVEAVKATVQRTADERVIRAELKAMAVKEGLIDLDDLKLIDISAIKIGDTGDLDGAEDVLKKFKESKPHKFGEASSSSSHSSTPHKKTGDETPKKATEMDKKEYEKEKAKLTARK